MQRAVERIPILLLCLSVPAAGSEAQDRPSSPAERYRALLKEYQVTSMEFRRAGTDEERKLAVERLDRFPPRFLELVERNPRDSIAVDALVEMVRAINAVDSLTQTAWDMSTTSFPAGVKDDSASRGIAVVLRDHIRSDKLGPVCQRMSYGIRKEYETFLRAVLEANPHRDVQALACMALAQFLNIRVQKLDLVKDRPEFADRYEELFGRDYFEELRRQGRTRIAGEVERLFERAVAEYGDVKIPYGDTAGEEASAELHEIRHLAAGKEAPDIEGEDQHGRRFKLSDYRGKVVLLDFWQEL